MKILIAEDNDANCDFLSRRLIRRGHDVIVTRNGLSAIENVALHQPDLVIMDVSMPVMSGLAATQHIRAAEREAGGRTPIIALTAHAMAEDREKCLAAGCDAFATKPVEFTALLDLISHFEKVDHV